MQYWVYFLKQMMTSKYPPTTPQNIIYQGPHSFSIFELKTFLKTFFTTLTTYCEKFAIFLRKLKIH